MNANFDYIFLRHLRCGSLSDGVSVQNDIACSQQTGDVYSMLGQRRRWWTSKKTAFDKRIASGLVFVYYVAMCYSTFPVVLEGNQALDMRLDCVMVCGSIPKSHSLLDFTTRTPHPALVLTELSCTRTPDL